MNASLADKLAIRETIENWALWSDSGDWKRFATVWHPQGRMSATWCQASAREFVAARREVFERGLSILHFLGGTTCDVRGAHAIAQTRMTIHQRAPVDGVLADVACTGRFYDFFVKHRAQWVIARRQPIYEKDRIDAVDPGAKIALDARLLAQYPEGYRHLAYLQVKNGFKVKTDMPGTRGPEVEQLYAEGKAWLQPAVRTRREPHGQRRAVYRDSAARSA